MLPESHNAYTTQSEEPKNTLDITGNVAKREWKTAEIPQDLHSAAQIEWVVLVEVGKAVIQTARC